MSIPLSLGSLLLAALASGPESAPHGPVQLKQLQVRAEIIDGAATTELRQVIRNDSGSIAEAVWVLPLPEGASADRFTMTVGGVEVESEVLDAQRARATYQAIVRRQRDPGLLEYIGRGCLRARIFPIQPHSDAVVVVRYRQILPEIGGLHQWTYPLRAPQVGALRPETISVDATIRSKTPIKNVWSPLAGVEVLRKSEHETRVSLELTRDELPDRDLSVFYGLSEKEFGLHLLTYRKAKQPGYFMVMLAPKRDWEEADTTKRSIQFVLDTSGSMQGPKIEQARKALRFFVQSLKPSDHFNVVPFSTEARPFFEAPVPATAENVDDAIARIAEITARGGTNIDDAMATALRGKVEADRVPLVVFLTDGKPTVGVTHSVDILRNLSAANGAKQRVFVLGVGHDVNTHLLDRMAATTRGVRDYVDEREDLEIKTGALFTKLSHPVMADVELGMDGVHEVMPRQLPDLFRGSRVLVLGRYDGDGGDRAVRLRGRVGDQQVEFVYEGAFPASTEDHDFLPTLWAERRVAYLLEQMRLHGKSGELTGEVTRLGKEFGIVTPFTSHLIVEEAVRVAGGPVTPSGTSRDEFFLGGSTQPRTGGRPIRYGGPGAVAPGAGGGRSAGPTGPGSAGPAGPSTPGAGPSTGGPTTGAGSAPRTGGRPNRSPEREARDANRRLEQLGKKPSGKGADADRRATTTGSDQLLFGSYRRGAAPASPATRLRKRVGDRTFYRAGEVWIDSSYRKSMQKKVEKIEAFSEAYFDLLEAEPKIAPYLSFAKRVRIVWGDRVIEIT